MTNKHGDNAKSYKGVAYKHLRRGLYIIYTNIPYQVQSYCLTLQGVKAYINAIK